MRITLNLAAIITMAGGPWNFAPALARVDAPEPIWLLVWGVALLALGSSLRQHRTQPRTVKLDGRVNALPVGWPKTAEGVER